jgi:hypothetical protein
VLPVRSGRKRHYCMFSSVTSRFLAHLSKDRLTAAAQLHLARELLDMDRSPGLDRELAYSPFPFHFKRTDRQLLSCW